MAVKAREIREMLQGKVDPGVVNYLCALAEQQQEFNQQLLEVAQAIDKITDMLGHYSTVFNDVGEMKKKIDSKESKVDGLPDHTE